MPGYRMPLDKYREQIDQIDQQLVELFNKRARAAREIGRIKEGSGGHVYVPAREEAVYRRLVASNPGPLPDSSLRNIYREIFSACRAVERKQVIDLAVARHDLTVPSRVADLAPLGFYAWDASSAVRGIRMRALEGAATAIGVLESVAGPTTRTVTAGGRGGGGNSDRGDGKGVLVGLDYRLFQWAGHPCIKALRPVFRTPDGPTRGAWHGGSGSYRSILARPGYAVGGMTAVSGSRVDGFQLTFMRVRGDRLDPRDSYQSPWLGGKGGGAIDLAGSGNPVVGIHGRHGLDLDAVGLIELSPPHRP